MSGGYDISVVISTYNRCQMLPGALDSVLDQNAGGVRYEVIVVDNNSTDSTREVVERYLERENTALKYVFEQKQGVSHARNTGLAHARAPIISFADDDVRVGRDWVASIKKELDEHPEVDFVGGKILPRWKTQPPAWLNRDHWWALALLDYGDAPFYVSADKPLCLPTANAAFRASLFERFGLFSPEFSGREDHEFLLRLWCGNVRGLYAPSIVVTAEVQPERLRRNYHRRWNTTTGRFNSAMRLNEIMGPDGRIVGEARDAVTLFGVPAFLFRNLLAEGLGVVSSTLQGRRAASLRHRNGLWYLIGYIGRRVEQNAARRDHSFISEIGSFVKALLRKKLSRDGGAAAQSGAEVIRSADSGACPSVQGK
jgi:glycosyltransferase involved in cell wall biosynthesis